MKLKNKRTGEIIEFDAILPVKDVSGDSVAHLEYNSLTELNEEWEDVPEEPKEYWCIDWMENDGIYRNKYEDSNDEFNKQIGNYFSSREEAELAVRKLKAWKRLKDKGFRFEGTNNNKRKTGYFINYSLGKSFNSQDECEQAMKDLDLLFRGEG